MSPDGTPHSCVKWLVHKCDMTHSFSLIRAYTFEWVMHVIKCDMTQSCVSWLLQTQTSLIDTCMTHSSVLSHLNTSQKVSYFIFSNRCYSRLQIGRYRILRLILKKSNFVPGVLGFSWDLSLVTIHYMVLIVNPMGRILVRWKCYRNNLKILCHPICNRLYVHYSFNLWLICDECDMTHENLFYFIFCQIRTVDVCMTYSSVTWLFHVRHNPCINLYMGSGPCRSNVWHDSFTCDMTRPSVENSFLCDMTHSCFAWFIRIWYDSFWCVGHDLFLCDMVL